MSHHRYIAKKVGDRVELVRDFEGMYRDVADPHGQAVSAGNLSHRIYRTVARALVEGLPDAGAAPVRYVDLGCGLGYFTEALVAELRKTGRAIDAHAVDVSEAAVTRAAERSREPIAYRRASLLDPASTVALGRFDLVTAFEVLYYFRDEEMPPVADHVARLVQPGGHLIVAYHLPEQMGYGTYVRSLDDLRSWFPAFASVWEMDFTDRYSRIYDGGPFGRHLFAALRKASDA